MTREYRMLVTVRIEGGPDTLPSQNDVVSEVARLVNDHGDLDVEVHGITWTDHPGGPDRIPPTHTVTTMRRIPAR